MPTVAGITRRLRRLIAPKPIDRFVHEVHGWTSYEQLEYLTEIVRSLPDHSLIVEVGVWHGRSALTMAEACRGTSKHVYAIDPWVSYESQEGTDYDGTEIVKNSGFNSFDEVFAKFLDHIADFRLSEYVTPLRSTGVAAARGWSHLNPAIVFIDANHTYEGVTGDLEAWSPLTNRICGDDWDFTGGVADRSVERAVRDFLNRHQEWTLTLPRGNTWEIRR